MKKDLVNRKRSRKELRAIYAKERKAGAVSTVEHENFLGGTRPLLAGDSPISKGRKEKRSKESGIFE